LTFFTLKLNEFNILCCCCRVGLTVFDVHEQFCHDSSFHLSFFNFVVSIVILDFVCNPDVFKCACSNHYIFDLWHHAIRHSLHFPQPPTQSAKDYLVPFLFNTKRTLIMMIIDVIKIGNKTADFSLHNASGNSINLYDIPHAFRIST
jgi:hypothetical protein